LYVNDVIIVMTEVEVTTGSGRNDDHPGPDRFQG
jgi:hypothetical protein